MTRTARRIAASVAAFALSTLTACGSPESSGGASATPTAIQGAVDSIQLRGLHAACNATVETIQVAGEAYYATNGTWPTTLGQLVTSRFLHAGTDLNATTGTMFTHPSAAGTYMITLTTSADGSATPRGTIAGFPC